MEKSEAAWFLPNEPLLGFINIPAGPFVMGSNKKQDPYTDDGETPQHTVDLPGYYSSRYPVTVAQFRAFVEQSGHQPEEEESLSRPLDQPVVQVSWYEALTYCEWLTDRLREWEGTPEPLATLLRKEGWRVTLPSEAEWEKAARGTDGRVYPWGDEFEANRANTDETGIGHPSAVGCFPQGASPYGCQDMAGNVWEWTRSLYGKYPCPTNQEEQARRKNLKAGDKKPRVLRGGSCWGNRMDARCADRRRFNPDVRSVVIGFRIVVRPCLPSDL